MKLIAMQSWQSIKLELRVMFGREPWWAELWSATASILWSIISVTSSIAVHESIIAFQLHSMLNIVVWEITGLTIGVFQLFSLLYGGIRWRWVAAFLGSWWWVFLTISIYIGSTALMPAIALYFVYACINLFSMVKLVRQYA